MEGVEDERMAVVRVVFRICIHNRVSRISKGLPALSGQEISGQQNSFFEFILFAISTVFSNCVALYSNVL